VGQCLRQLRLLLRARAAAPGLHPAKARRIAANIAKLPNLLTGFLGLPNGAARAPITIRTLVALAPASNAPMMTPYHTGTPPCPPNTAGYLKNSPRLSTPINFQLLLQELSNSNASDRGKYLQAARAMESLTWIYCRRSFGTPVGRAHAPIITCLAESNPLRPTQCIRLERRLRCNRGPARPSPSSVSALAIVIANATIPQCFL
jgi:hypothetical protein